MIKRISIGNKLPSDYEWKLDELFNDGYEFKCQIRWNIGQHDYLDLVFHKFLASTKESEEVK